MKIELIDSQIQSAVLTAGYQHQLAVSSNEKINCVYWDINITGSEVIIKFSPNTIKKPLLRINGFLIDYWTAKIEHWPGHLKFYFDEKFFDQYHLNNLQDRLNSLGTNPSDLTVDRVVGRNLHLELVNKLLETINEKSIVN